MLPSVALSLTTATLELAGVLLLLSHSQCRRHKGAAASIGLFVVLELCESVLWVLATRGTCDVLNATLVRVCGCCLAAQPLAIAWYAHDRRNLTPVPLETTVTTYVDQYAWSR